MPATSDGVVKVINAGVKIESVDAAGRTSDSLIKIGHAIIAHGGMPRFTNCQSVTSDSIIKVSSSLGGKAVFEGI